MNNSNQSSFPYSNNAASGWLVLPIICLCFILSGLAALIYQTVWARKFALVFGTSELAIAAVLAAYMGGLALGAWYIERWIKKIRKPLIWYANIELGIALAAVLIIPAGHWLVEWVLVAVFGGQPSPPEARLGATSLFYLIAAFAVLLIPTTLMGATLPLLVSYAVHSERQIGGRVGLLYTCNTLGAVGGALLGALLLLPRLGLSKTVWIAAAVNLLVALIAYGLSQASRGESSAPPLDRNPGSDELPERFCLGSSAAWVLPLMMFSGAVSFLHEVLWTRMLGHVLGSSIYAFGVMLASFLAGIALGGGLGALLARYRQMAARWLAVSELAAAIAALGAWYLLQHIDLSMDSMADRVLFGFSLLFALSFAIGMTYPLAVRVLARDVESAAQASARVYSWNTLGAIAGAIAGGFLIVPALRYEGAVQLAVIASCVLAVIASVCLFRLGKVFVVTISVPAIALAILFNPQPPDSLLRYSPIEDSGTGEMLYYDVGRSAAVVTLRLGDLINVRTNGLPEAAIDLRGTSPRLYSEAWMAPLAVLARPNLRDMLVVGFGGGRVIEAVPPSVETVDVIELEDKVIDANLDLTNKGLRDPLHDPLLDPRVHLVVNDARGALQLTTKKYDAVISQPSHPWTAGASHLYTREFMQQAREHLNTDGVFVQWMNIRFLDESLLRSLLATINSVFPHVRVYRPEPPTLLFMGSDAPIEPEINVEVTRAAFDAAPEHYGRLGLNVLEDLVASLVLDNAGSRKISDGVRVITDDTNRFAVASVHEYGLSISAEMLGLLLAPYDPLRQADSFIYEELQDELAFEYVARRIRSQGRVDSSALQRASDVEALAAQVELQNQSNAESSASEAIITRAMELAGIGDWRELAALDSDLDAIPWTSEWVGQAEFLRILWRLQFMEAGAGANAEVISMVDRLLLVEQDPALYLYRAMGAGNDSYILTESLFRYALAVLQGLVNHDENMRAQFDVLFNRFQNLGQANQVYPYHYIEVQNALTAVSALGQ